MSLTVEIMQNQAITMFLYMQGGRVTLIGLPKSPLVVENVLQDIVFKSLNLNSVHGRRIFHTWEECERLIAEKKVNVFF